jgi:hypothetical protein
MIRQNLILLGNLFFSDFLLFTAVNEEFSYTYEYLISRLLDLFGKSPSLSLCWRKELSAWVKTFYLIVPQGSPLLTRIDTEDVA